MILSFEKCVKAVLLAGLVIGATRLAEKKTDGFTELAIHSERDYDIAWETRPLTENEQVEFDLATSQKYRYFGCGGQAFALFSEDGKYVIKFFKQRVYRVPFLLKLIPLPWPLKRYQVKRHWKKSDKLYRDFMSYKMAFEELQDLTGLIYIHLNTTQRINRQLMITDKLGQPHLINLDEVDFVLQKRAEMVHDRINTLMRQGAHKEAEEAITSVLNLVIERAKRGLLDRDPNVRTNCGFIDKQAIKVDVGRFTRDQKAKDPNFFHADLLKIAAPFKTWIAAHHPTLLNHFEKELLRFTHE